VKHLPKAWTAGHNLVPPALAQIVHPAPVCLKTLEEKECHMESQQRLHMIMTFNEEADQKRLALTHALGAQERIQQGPVSTHGAPLTQEEQALKYERDLWERLQLSLNEAENILTTQSWGICPRLLASYTYAKKPPERDGVLGSCRVACTEHALLVLAQWARTHSRWLTAMDTDDKLRNILGQLRGGRLEDVADKLIALFRPPEWWEEEFAQQFVVRGSIGAFHDAETCEAVKAFIRTLLTRVQHEARQQLLMDIAQISETFCAGAASPEEAAAARTLSVVLHDLRHKYGMPPA
jgi:hypothetical protein